MKRIFAAVLVWVAALGVIGVVRADAKNAEKYVVPDVVGMTVQQGYDAYIQALIDSGWVEGGPINFHVQPGNQDWQGTDLANCIIVKQAPKAGVEAKWHTALNVWIECPEPTPTPTPTETPTVEPTPTPTPTETPTETPTPEPTPTDKPKPDKPKPDKDEPSDYGELMFTM